MLSCYDTYSPNYYDTHRFERISNIIKQFKISCAKTQVHFQSLEVKSSNFIAFINMITKNLYIMVVMVGPKSKSSSSLIQLNIASAKKFFDKFIPDF